MTAGAPDHRVVVDTWCPECGAMNSVAITPESFSRWQMGEALQQVAPYLTPEEREHLISGLCPDCWKQMEDHLDRNH